MMTKQEIRRRHRAKPGVKEAEAKYSAERYSRIKTDPALNAKLLERQRHTNRLIYKRHRLRSYGMPDSLLLNPAFNLRALSDLLQCFRENELEEQKLATLERRVAKIKGRKKAAPKILKERIAKRQAKTYQEKSQDPAWKAKRAEWHRKWREKNKSHLAAYQNQKRRTDINFRIADNLRRRINSVLKAASKCEETLLLLGCSFDELLQHLKSQFVSGMSWENYGHGSGKWTIDHKTPCAAFDLTEPEQQKACFHYTNLQPMWFLDNCSKNSRTEPNGKAIRTYQLTE